MKPNIKSLKKRRSNATARTARKFRTMRVEANERITIAEEAPPCLMVVKNHGPGKVKIETKYRNPVELLSGQLRLVQTFEHICIEAMDKNSALLEVEFMPTAK